MSQLKNNDTSAGIKKFFEKYFKSSSGEYREKGLDFFHAPLLSSTFWHTFLRDGKFSKKELDDSIKNSKYFSKNNSQAPWVRLWHFHELNEDIFGEILTKVKNDFNGDKYIQPEVILHIAGMLLFFSRKKFIKDSIECTVTYIKNKINQLTSLNKLDCFEAVSALKSSGSSHGLCFCDIGSDEFNDVFSFLESSIMKMKYKIIESDLQPIFQGGLRI